MGSVYLFVFPDLQKIIKLFDFDYTMIVIPETCPTHNTNFMYLI